MLEEEKMFNFVGPNFSQRYRLIQKLQRFVFNKVTVFLANPFGQRIFCQSFVTNFFLQAPSSDARSATQSMNVDGDDEDQMLNEKPVVHKIHQNSAQEIGTNYCRVLL